jgi:hypothetical protein
MAPTLGGVASYLNEKSPLPTFPALSRHVPATEVPAVSGPPKPTDEQDAIRDVASVPENEAVNGRVYQPFASGGRSAAPLTVGAVLSSLIVMVLLALPPSLRAQQVKSVRTVSVTSVLAPQP